jgi:hypothetical protein
MRLTVVLFLPSVITQALAKITVTIKKTDGYQRNTQITRRLKMITSQNAQAARIEWQ